MLLNLRFHRRNHLSRSIFCHLPPLIPLRLLLPLPLSLVKMPAHFYSPPIYYFLSLHPLLILMKAGFFLGCPIFTLAMVAIELTPGPVLSTPLVPLSVCPRIFKNRLLFHFWVLYFPPICLRCHRIWCFGVQRFYLLGWCCGVFPRTWCCQLLLFAFCWFAFLRACVSGYYP